MTLLAFLLNVICVMGFFKKVKILEINVSKAFSKLTLELELIFFIPLKLNNTRHDSNVPVRKKGTICYLKFTKCCSRTLKFI